MLDLCFGWKNVPTVRNKIRLFATSYGQPEVTPLIRRQLPDERHDCRLIALGGFCGDSHLQA